MVQFALPGFHKLGRLTVMVIGTFIDTASEGLRIEILEWFEVSSYKTSGKSTAHINEGNHAFSAINPESLVVSGREDCTMTHIAWRYCQSHEVDPFFLVTQKGLTFWDVNFGTELG